MYWIVREDVCSFCLSLTNIALYLSFRMWLFFFSLLSYLPRNCKQAYLWRINHILRVALDNINHCPRLGLISCSYWGFQYPGEEVIECMWPRCCVDISSSILPGLVFCRTNQAGQSNRYTSNFLSDTWGDMFTIFIFEYAKGFALPLLL